MTHRKHAAVRPRTLGWVGLLALLWLGCGRPLAAQESPPLAFSVALQPTACYAWRGDCTGTFGSKSKNCNATFSREIVIRGTDIGSTRPESALLTVGPERLALLALHHIPAQDYAQGKSQTSSFTWRDGQACALTWSVGDAVTVRDVPLRLLTGTASITPHPWLNGEGKLEFSAYYNPATRLIERFVFKFQGTAMSIPVWFSRHHGASASTQPFSVNGDLALHVVTAAEGLPLGYAEDAVESAAQFLFTKQQSNGSWKDSFGLTALCMTALLKGGIAPEDPRMEKGADYLLANCQKTDPLDTYEIQIYAHALSSLYAYTNQDWLEAKGRGAKTKTMVQHGASILEKNFRAILGWNDMSRTQYGSLGLFSAYLTGHFTPEVKTLRNALKFHADMLAKDGRESEVLKRVRTVTPVAAGAPSIAVMSTVEVKDAKSKQTAKGWGYLGKDKPCASLTAGAVGSIHFIKLMLEQMDAWTPDDQAIFDEISACGHAWLHDYFSAYENIGSDGWFYYYLYALERACTMGGWEYLGTHDWYLEGAVQLMKEQDATGKFQRNDSNTPEEAAAAFGILFYRRGSDSLRQAKRHTSKHDKEKKGGK